MGVKMKMKEQATILILVATLAGGCGQDPVVTAAQKQHREFVGAKPKTADIVGTYVLSDQSVIPGGLSALGGLQCQLEVFADGTFSITNYPECASARSSNLKQFERFHTTTGTWELSTVGVSYGYGPDPKDCWGLRFSGCKTRIDPTAFTGPNPPYGLITIIGDPDSNDTIRFKKKEHPTTASTAYAKPGAAE